MNHLNTKESYKYVWSSRVYKITFMNEKGYLIDDYSKRKVFQRNEMLKLKVLKINKVNLKYVINYIYFK